MSINLKIVAIALSLVHGSALAFDLDEGVAKNKENTYELTQTTSKKAYAYGTALLTHRKFDDQGVSAFYIQDDLNRVVSLSRGMTIYITDLENDSVVNSWPITRWPKEYLEKEVSITYEAGNFYEAGDPDTYVSDDAKLTHLMGCMQKTPLRYGDFTGDGSSELVVFLSDEVSTDIRVFSLEKEKVIFSSKLNFTDSRSREDIPDYYLHDAPYQYLSWRHVNSDLPAFPATKAYAKLYVGDLDEDGQKDLLVWRKLYQSRKVEDETEGFEMLDEKLLHHTLVEGEYQPQETEEEVIRGWLAENELTWQKGYPSKSECEGEEGELIPEMHDPLLNDPDVLQ